MRSMSWPECLHRLFFPAGRKPRARGQSRSRFQAPLGQHGAALPTACQFVGRGVESLETRALLSGLTIIPTFDTSITSDPNSATIQTTINQAIANEEAQFSDNITLNILFQSMASGLGQSGTWLNDLDYSTFRSQLASDATTSNDATALANLPGGSTEPVQNSPTVRISWANFKALGIDPGNSPDGYDGTIGLNTSICNLDRSSINPGKYDLMAVAEHEIDEVMGLGSGVGTPNTRPQDLFRYDSSGVRSFDPSSSAVSFLSLDGTNDIVQFNQDGTGDYGDWFSTGPHTPRVQDAFGTPGSIENLGPAELINLDVIGYNLQSAVDVTPPTITDPRITITSTGSGTGGTYIAGDTVTARWDSSATGDNNTDVAAATMDFSQFGGPAAVVATNQFGIWTASYTITAGTIDATNRNVSVSATDFTSNSATTADSSNLSVDNQPPTVTDPAITITSTGSGTGGAYIVGDTVTVSWNNTVTGDNNGDVTSVKVDFSAFGGPAAVAAINNSGTWTASYTITAGTIDATKQNVVLTATDDAGNVTTTADGSDLTIDNQPPTVTDANITIISAGTGPGGTYRIGDTVRVIWNNTALGDNNSDIAGVTVDFSQFGGSNAVVAVNNSGTWIASYVIQSGTIDATAVDVSVSVLDDAGNTTSTNDTGAVAVDNQGPTVTDPKITITSTGSGIGGVYKIGDTVTVQWDNTAAGDDNADISSVAADFSKFGGPTAVAATDSAEIWTASYTIVAGIVDAQSLNVSIQATDDGGNSTTTADSSDLTVDNQAPTVTDPRIRITSSGSGTGGAYRIGDTLTVIWDNTAAGDNNADMLAVSNPVTVNFSLFGGPATAAATNNSGVWTASYTITSGTIDGVNSNVSVTVTDNAGNTSTTADSSNLTIDNQPPVVTDAGISITSTGSGVGGRYRAGDIVKVQWDNTATGDNNLDGLAATTPVTVDFTQFGGPAAVAASNAGGIWTASYTIAPGTTTAANRNVSVTVTDNAGNATTSGDTTNLLVDNQAPTGVWGAVAALTKTPVGSVSITFSENVQNVSLDDFTLNGTKLSTLTGSGTISLSSAGNVYTIGGLAGYDAKGNPNTTYQLAVAPANNIQDLASNALFGTPSVTWTMDTLAPTAAWTTVTARTNTPVDSLSITFSENVKNVSLDDFTINGAGLNTFSGLSLQRTGTKFTINGLAALTFTGTPNTTYTVAVASSNNISDLAGNALSGTPGVTWVMDSIAPTLVSMNRLSPASQVTTASNLTFLARFSERVSGVNANAAADFALSGTATAGGKIGTPTTSDGGLSWSIPVTGLGNNVNGTVELDLTGGTGIQDLAKNDLATSTFNGQAYTLDHIAPTLVSINRSVPSGQFTNATSVTFLATFSEQVNGVNTNAALDFALSGTATSGGVIGTPTTADGGRTWSIPVTGLGSNAAGTVELDLIRGAGITDPAAHALATTARAGQAYILDHTAPTLTSINRRIPAGQITNGTSVTFVATFSERVTGVNTNVGNDFALSGTAIAGGTLGTPTTSDGGLTWSIPVTGLGNTSDGSVQLNLARKAGITDLAGNGLATSTLSGQSYILDHTPPTLIGLFRSSPANSLTNAASVTFLVKFSEAVTGVNTNAATDFALAGSGSTGARIGTPTTNNGGFSWLVPVTGLGASNGSVQLNLARNTGIKDTAANTLPISTLSGQSYLLDHTAPTLTGIFRAAPAGQFTTDTSLSFLVKFSEAVTGVDTNAAVDFALSGAAAAGGQIGTPTSTNGGLTWTIPVTGLSATANGTVQLNLTRNTGIQDLAANRLATSTFSGQFYRVDHVAPTLTGIYRASPTSQFTTDTSLGFLVKFSEAVTGVDANVDADFVLSGSGSAGGRIGTPTTNNGGISWSILVTGLSSTVNGFVELDLTDGGGIHDLAGNALATASSSGLAFTLDHVAPTGTWGKVASPRHVAANSATISFTEAVQGVTTDNLTLNGTKLSTLAGVTVFQSGNSYTVSGLAAHVATGNPNTTYTLATATGIRDLAGNALAKVSTVAWVMDTVAPSATWSSVVSPTKTAVNSVKVTFSEAVQTVALSDFTLNGTKLSALSGVTLTHAGNVYTISGLAAHVATGNPNTTYTVSIASTNGIHDLAGNALASATNVAWVMDKVAPVATWTAFAGHTNTLVNSLKITFSEAVRTVALGDFTLNGARLSTLSGVTLSHAGNVYTITGLGTHTGTGNPNTTYTVAVASTNGIQDLAGTALSGQPAVTWVMDTIAPRGAWKAVATPTHSAVNSLQITFSEALQSVALSDFTLNGAALSTLSGVTLSHAGNVYTISGLAAHTGKGNPLTTYTVAVASNNGLHDLAGNAVAKGTGATWQMDTSAPSDAWTTVAAHTKTAVGSVKITFTEPVQNVALTDFTLNGTKLSVLSGVTLAHTGNVYTIGGLASHTATGNPNTRYTVALSATNGIHDAAGNPLQGAPAVSWLMDTIAPRATWSSVPSSTTSFVDSIKITFSEPVLNVTLSSFALNDTAFSDITDVTLTALSGNQYLIQGFSNSDTLPQPYTISVVSGNTIKDLAGNLLSSLPSVTWVLTNAPASPSFTPAAAFNSGLLAAATPASVSSGPAGVASPASSLPVTSDRAPFLTIQPDPAASEESGLLVESTPPGVDADVNDYWTNFGAQIKSTPAGLFDWS